MRNDQGAAKTTMAKRAAVRAELNRGFACDVILIEAESSAAALRGAPEQTCQSAGKQNAPRRYPGAETMTNALKTAALFGVLTAILVAIGFMIGGVSGLVVFLVLAAIMNFIAYWMSDKIALRMAGAREVTPEEEPRLHAIVDELSSLAGTPKPKVYVVDTPTPNAFATGRNPKHAVVAVTTGIQRILSERELRGVMAHELGHVRNRDILISTIVATVAGAIALIANIMQWSLIFGRGDRNNPLGIVGVLATIILAPIAAAIVQSAISRQREYGADESGARLIHDPDSLADALLKLEQGNQMHPMKVNPAAAHLYIVSPLASHDYDNMRRSPAPASAFGGGFGSFFSTHPPIQKRVERLRQMSGSTHLLQ
jgi:heat shock protein HtpX